MCILHHPFHRGGLKSLTAEDIVDEAKALLGQGVRELDLVAQDLTSWGVDLGLKHGLSSLLEKLVGLDGLAWLRLLYLYPSGVTPELLRFIRDCGARALSRYSLQRAPMCCPAWGGPLRATPGACLTLCGQFCPMPHCARPLLWEPLTTDEHFEALCRFVEESRFSSCGRFCLSCRRRTNINISFCNTE